VTVLSVNVNKIAVLRNSRGGTAPDVVRAARACLDAGAHGITVHPRPDARHIQARDVLALAALCRERDVEFNLEGNPFAPPREHYPGFHALCAQARPTQATLVPDGDAQLTSDHGFDFDRDADNLRPHVAALKALDCRVSLFVDAGDPQVAEAAAVGADRVELYTGPFASAFSEDAARGRALFATHVSAAQRAHALGLGVNAGHDLDLENLVLYRTLPHLDEVSIGHAIVSRAVFAGLAMVVREYLERLDHA